MQFIQTSSETYLRTVRSALADIFTEKELELNLQVNYDGSPDLIFKAFAEVENIHELDKKEIFNYSISIFGVLTDIREKNDTQMMLESLEVAFRFIEGYTKDKATQIKLYTLLYNVFKQNEVSRYHIFDKFLTFCEQNDSIVILKNNLMIIDQIASQWEISKNQRITLYKRVIQILAEDEKLAAYELMLKTIRLFGDDETLIVDNKDLITQAIRLALEHPKIAQFEYLYDVAAVQTLKKKNADEKIISLLEIFVSEELDSFKKWEGDNKSFLESSGIEASVLKNKIFYLSLFKLAGDDNMISFDKLAETVGIPKSEVEDWVIDAIVNGIIDARIDQEEEKVIINTFPQKSSKLGDRLEKTLSNFDSVLSKIDA